MEYLKLSEEKLNKLKPYKLRKGIDNNESKLYLYSLKELLKVFKSNDEHFKSNKLYVLNKLFYIKDHLNLKEFVLPNKLININSLSFGYTMDFIKQNTNLSLILKSKNISIEDKIFFIKKIGNILEKIENNEVLKTINFHLGDIHEGNFIYDNKNNMIKVVDLDSSYVTSIDAPISKFLTFNDKLWDYPIKYPLDENDRHIPNKNTTILSYIFILLNFLTDEYSPNISSKEFLDILNILYYIGFNKELLDSIYNIYSIEDNYFNYELIDTITPNLVLKFKEIKNVKK